MCRTKADFELKMQGKSGPPFFNLRETILVILLEHFSKSKVCVDLRLFLVNSRLGLPLPSPHPRRQATFTGPHELILKLAAVSSFGNPSNPALGQGKMIEFSPLDKVVL